MASFIKRNGRWTARIRKTGYPETTHTFARRDSALKWSQKVETTLQGRQDCLKSDATHFSLYKA